LRIIRNPDQWFILFWKNFSPGVLLSLRGKLPRAGIKSAGLASDFLPAL
jgi:hypothetical protein